MSRAGYDPASGSCAGRSQPGALALMAWCLAAYEPAGNLGIYNCRNTRGGTSKSVHADGRALDVAFPLDTGGLANPLGHDLAARLVARNAALGIQCVIYDRMIWTSRRPKWMQHCPHPDARSPHLGCSGPHLDHVHIELTWAASKGPFALTVEDVSRALGPVAPAEADMTDEEHGWLARIHHEVAAGDTKSSTVTQMLERLTKAVEALHADLREAHGLTD